MVTVSRPSASADPKPTLTVQALLATWYSTTTRRLGTTSATMAMQALAHISITANPLPSCKLESIPAIMATLGLRNFIR